MEARGGRKGSGFTIPSSRQKLFFWLGVSLLFINELLRFQTRWRPSSLLTSSPTTPVERETEHRFHPPTSSASSASSSSSFWNNLISLARFSLVSLCILSLIANQLSLSYCSGHTVLSAFLTWLTSKFIEREKYIPSLRLLEWALRWDRIWLEEGHPLLASNYSNLAVVCTLLHRHRAAALYSRRLADLTATPAWKLWSHKRQLK